MQACQLYFQFLPCLPSAGSGEAPASSLKDSAWREPLTPGLTSAKGSGHAGGQGDEALAAGWAGGEPRAWGSVGEGRTGDNTHRSQ